MVRPVVGANTEEAYAALLHRTEGDEATDWITLRFLEGNLLSLQALNDIIRDTDDGRPGWQSIINLDEAPPDGLPYLAQFVGARLITGLDDATQRTRIHDVSGRNRGRPEALAAAAAQYLIGTKRVDIFERDTGDAYKVRVRTFSSETPDSAKVQAALMAEKPAGLILTYQLAGGMTYDELKAAYTTFDAQKAAVGTFDDMKALVP
jgi:hypothetical protein